jgi:hypothetical protein
MSYFVAVRYGLDVGVNWIKYWSHRFEQFRETNCCDVDSHIGNTVGDDEHISVQHRTTGIHNIGDVAVLLIGTCRDERLFERRNHFVGMFQVQENGANAVRSHGPHPVSQHEPTGRCFDR